MFYTDIQLVVFLLETNVKHYHVASFSWMREQGRPPDNWHRQADASYRSWNVFGRWAYGGLPLRCFDRLSNLSSVNRHHSLARKQGFMIDFWKIYVQNTRASQSLQFMRFAPWACRRAHLKNHLYNLLYLYLVENKCNLRNQRFEKIMFRQGGRE